MKKNILLAAAMLTMVTLAEPVQARTGNKVNSEVKSDSVPQLKKQEKKSFWKSVMKPIKWFGKQWSDYDPKYSTPSFYNWVGQIQNKFSKEWLNMKYSDGMEVKMHSDLSSKIGPYLGYSFIGYGYSVDVTALKGSKRKTESGLSINSNLMNIDFIYRRTGGDFTLSKMTSGHYDPVTNTIVQKDITDIANNHNFGDEVKYNVTGVNFNYFINHRKYSNPAAFSNGAIQLKSAGSPIVGFGYIRQSINNTITDLVENAAFSTMSKQLISQGYDMNELYQAVGKKYGVDIADGSALRSFMTNTEDDDQYRDIVNTVINYRFSNETGEKNALQTIMFGDIKDGKLENTTVLNMLLNKIPSHMSVDDWHLQLGYAYNIVFSKRLLLGLSFIASPGLKHVKMNNDRNMTNTAADVFATAMNNYYGSQRVDASTFIINTSHTRFGTDFFGRASLTFNFNRWRAGANFSCSAYLYNRDEALISNAYGNCNLYVGYCFGRKAQYRWNGKDRQAYIMAALRPKDIEAMKDTMPLSNLAIGPALAVNLNKKTKYDTDFINFNIYGCDLVKGPDGTYGTYEIEDGLITPGQDSEGKLKPGTVIPVEENGGFKISCGHERGFRAATWWKSQLSVRQIPTNWYPEMLHYALRGKLTVWIRSYKLGSKEPMKLVIEDFCVAHGKDTKDFVQIASKKFHSHSAYSIIGNVNVNGRLTRVYIESRKQGKINNFYISPLLASRRSWMGNVPDDRPIARMSIPATHDAGTASLPEGGLTSMGHTQNTTIAEQLEDGIRAFDIRLKKNMKFGHTMMCRDGLPETLELTRQFLKDHPTEFIVAMIGSDEGGKWDAEMISNFSKLVKQYSDIMIDSFSPRTKLGDVRGKILVIKRQAACPFGKHLKFQDNCVFENNGFCVEDVYKEHKTYKKIKIVEKHLREAHECLDPDKWYITFNSIAWDPRHHKPYYAAWGATNIRKPMNPSLREVIELKNYNNFGMLFLDFYNDHCDRPHLVEAIIESNFSTEVEKDFIPAE